MVTARCDECGTVYEDVDYVSISTGKSKRCRKCGHRKSRQTRTESVFGRAKVSGDRTIYNRYKSIVARTTNPKCPEYVWYGARGICLADEFKDFKVFNAYVRGLPDFDLSLSIDRIDNNKGYEPGNLRFASAKQQNRNTRNAVRISYEGQDLSARDFIERHVHRYRPHVAVRLAKAGLTGEEILERERKSPRAGIRHIKRGSSKSVLYP